MRPSSDEKKIKTKEKDSQPNEAQKKSGSPQLGREEVFNLSALVLHRNGSQQPLSLVSDLHLTSLKATIVASGMGLLFCLAMYLRVFTALAVCPDRMSKEGLSGSHCGTRRGLVYRLFLFWGTLINHECTYVGGNKKHRYGEHGKPQQPPPAQSGHDQQRQEDLQYGAKRPGQLENTNTSFRR